MTTYIWSIDDAGSGGSNLVESLERMSQFFTSRGVPSTWFAIPKPGGQSLTAAWKKALLAARDAGHDLQLHGLTHADCYEYGPPAWPATAILSTLQADFDRQREELLPRYRLENLRARLEEGIEIFDRELGVQPTAFRAPCGAICKAMYEALRQLGIFYQSSMYISATGYEHLAHNSGRLVQKWSDDIPHRPFRWYSDVVEAPILNEYTWRGAGQRSAEFIELAKHDLDRIAQESPIVVLLMHTHGI